MPYDHPRTAQIKVPGMIYTYATICNVESKNEKWNNGAWEGKRN
jgi:hypothetical protein